MGNVRLVATRLSPRLTRLFDITVSLAALIVLSPVILAGCVGVWLSNPGPVFFSQVRIGLRGKPFRIHKLRSMYTDAEERQKKILAQNQMPCFYITNKSFSFHVYIFESLLFTL
ncbi:MAG: sugar transferase [Sphaerospermopsis sp. SIO1G2]|nr:sugar transferase [Sphaerospermopsis sp. SIO1G2]